MGTSNTTPRAKSARQAAGGQRRTASGNVSNRRTRSGQNAYKYAATGQNQNIRKQSQQSQNRSQQNKNAQMKKRRKKKQRQKRAMIAVICAVAAACFILIAAVMHFRTPAYDTNTIVLKSFGHLTEYIVEDFPQDNYSKDAFNTYVKQQIDTYVGSHDSGAVKLKSTKYKDNVLKMTLNYKTAEDYAAFNSVTFVRSEGDALETSALARLKSVSLTDTQGNTQTLDSIDKSQYNVVLTDYAVDIVVPKDIVYVSSNVTLKDARCAAATDSVSVIFYEK